MDMNVIVNEVICTFIFVSVVLMVKGKHTAGGIAGLRAATAVCFTLMSIIASTSRLGASFNPAVGISLTLNSFWLLKPAQPYMYHYMYAYILGPFFGGFLAALFHKIHAKAHIPLVDEEPAQKTNFVTCNQ
jgi:glycerol uptake facilitator-like aquaporin